MEKLITIKISDKINKINKDITDFSNRSEINKNNIKVITEEINKIGKEIEQVNNEKDVLKLKQFSQQFYTVEKWNDTLVFNDLRFGQIVGWQNPEERFAFHYYIQYPDANKLVVQRGRFAKWDWNVVKTFWKRIKGD